MAGVEAFSLQEQPPTMEALQAEHGVPPGGNPAPVPVQDPVARRGVRHSRKKVRGVISQNGRLYTRIRFGGKMRKFPVPDGETGERLFKALRKWRRVGAPLPNDLRSLASSIVGGDEILSVGDILKLYVDSRQSRESIADIKNDAKHWNEKLGSERVTGLDKKGIARLIGRITEVLDGWRKAGLSPWTVNHRRTTLAAAFNYVEKKRLRIEVQENPFHYGIARQGTEDRSMVSMTFGMFVLILRECPAIVRPVLVFMACTGRRVGEAVRLERVHVRLEKKEYFCRPEKRGRPGWYPLVGMAVDCLRVQPVIAGEPRVFPVSAGYVSHAFMRAVRSLYKKGLVRTEDLRLHDLRHAVSSWLNEAGTTTKDLQDFIGWKSPEMAMRYPKPVAAAVAAKAEAISAGLGAAGLTPSDFALLPSGTRPDHPRSGGSVAGKSDPKSVPPKIDSAGDSTYHPELTQ
ncbi:MAG: tyrosine-type recombinase/integrase [Nitrospirae bacterium]|nr:tyrosine-type recombinase/integrase [Nitrospirota bacterium]